MAHSRSRHLDRTVDTARRVIAAYGAAGGVVVVQRSRRAKVQQLVEQHLHDAAVRHDRLWARDYLLERLEPGVTYRDFDELAAAASVRKKTARRAIIGLLEDGALERHEDGFRLARAYWRPER